jgi:hypothetical protein
MEYFLIMKLTTQLLPEYFTIAGPENSHYTEPTNCLDFVDRNSPYLLATIGESWTYGSELSNRLSQVWGNLVSTHFGWDWLNLSQPGCSNFFIADWAKELSKLSDQLHYKKIYIVCLFTEIGRGFNSHHDANIDYSKWFENNCHKSEDFYKFLEMLNKHCADRIVEVSTGKISSWFGSNFIDHLGLPELSTLPSPWFRLLGLSCNQSVYSSTAGVTRLQQIKEFLPSHKLNLYKNWIADMITSAELVDKICHNSAEGRTISHPDDCGHSLWANYVIKYLEKNATI